MSLEANIAPFKTKPAEHLFERIRLGRMMLPHRIAMAPLTRSRARQPGNVPTPLNAAYYVQRACAALIVSEATQAQCKDKGMRGHPAFTAANRLRAGVSSLMPSTQRAGGFSFSFGMSDAFPTRRCNRMGCYQSRHLPSARPVRHSSRAIAERANSFPSSRRGRLISSRCPTSSSSTNEALAMHCAAGFDGVEIHSANGYLLDQFINSQTNTRTDTYGGSIRNRSRLLFEVVEAVKGVWGGDRVGVRLSPLGTFNDIGDSDPEATFGTIAEQLSGQDLAYLHLVNPATADLDQGREPNPRALAMLDLMRAKYRGTLMLAGGFDRDSAETWLQKGGADVVAFGRKFLANPDLPRRLRERAPLNADDPTTYYGGGAKGYTDYPTLEQERGEAPKPCVDDRWR